MTDRQLFQEHDRFRAGKEGTCSQCTARSAFAFATEDEIDAGFPSRHDTMHFLWLDQEPEQPPLGFICDQCIDRLIGEGRIEAYLSDMGGPLPDLSERGAAVAYALGARRMQAILGLPVNEDGEVMPESLSHLPLSLVPRNRSRLIKHVELVTGFSARTADYNDPEGAGRCDALIRVATGTPADTDIAATATQWARKRAWHKQQDQEIDDMILPALDRLAQGHDYDE